MENQSDTRVIPQNRWKRSRYANLQRDSVGNYRVCAKVGGVLFRKVLGVMSENSAVAWRDKLLAVQRAVMEVRIPNADSLTLAYAVAIFEQQVKSDPELMPNSVDYKIETIDGLRRTWPDFDEQVMSKIKRAQVDKWAKVARAKYSAPRFNGMLQSLRAMFKIGAGVGAMVADLAKEVKRASVKSNQRAIPSRDNLAKMFKAAESVTQARKGAVVLRLMYHTGCRPFELRNLLPEHVAMSDQQFWVHGKNGEKRAVPIFPAARKIFKELLRDHPGKGRLLPIANPKKTLAAACARAKIPRMRPYDLRHLFVTRCLESGVDVRTVAEWIGHKDKGELLLKRYAHARDEHGRAMVAKVRF